MRFIRQQLRLSRGVYRSIRRLSQSTTARAEERLSPSSELSDAATSADGKLAGSASAKSRGARAHDEEGGAMSRRLAELAEQSHEDAGGARAQKLAREAGFSEELLRKLEDRIEASAFESEHAAALSQINLPASAGRGTRDLAAARPWTGVEAQEDAVLRMLEDKHKPLRGTPPAAVPLPFRAPQQRLSSGQRLANARERSSIYSYANDSANADGSGGGSSSSRPSSTGMSPEEQAQVRQELKERFAPGARSMPATLHGLAALANERIEDAIARGQFRNLPRGRAIERDYNASSPFLDTTEYFMNKIIQKQDIVPPWIEKQQELARAAAVFRARLRTDWRRHAARMIASQGGSLADQVRRAEGYAAAERGLAPAAVDDTAAAAARTEGATVSAKVEPAAHAGEIGLAGAPPSETAAAPASSPAPPADASAAAAAAAIATAAAETANSTSAAFTTPARAAPAPFRDAAWERAELSYHTLSVANLNSLTRSYNLVAPDLAKKPYFSLERELRACFAEVAPQLADEIRERSRPRARTAPALSAHHRSLGLFEMFGAARRASSSSSTLYGGVSSGSGKPLYGLKEYFRDLWASFSKRP